MCRVWEGGAEGLSLGEVEALLSRAGELSWADVTGGEIFLRPDAEELLALFVGKCPRLAVLHFPTNGWFPDRVLSAAKRLAGKGSPTLLVTVSLDGPREVHDAIRGARGAYDRALETFARLREVGGCRVSLGLTLSEANLGRVEETVEAVRKTIPAFSPRELHVNLPNRSPHYYRNAGDSLPGAEALLAAVRTVRRIQGLPTGAVSFAERRLLSLAERYLATGRTPIPCTALRSTCFVGADGTVRPCVTWDRPLGNLRDTGHDLAAILASPEAEAARRDIAAGRCPHCWTACEAVPSLLARWGRGAA
jgi:MoaA/NifB/PqqE/SkfB family radical SAM enzyme